jgi:hypothetical protein
MYFNVGGKLSFPLTPTRTVSHVVASGRQYMSRNLLIIVVHQAVFQGMFFAKNIVLHRRLGVPIRGTNREANC